MTGSVVFTSLILNVSIGVPGTPSASVTNASVIALGRLRRERGRAIDVSVYVADGLSAIAHSKFLPSWSPTRTGTTNDPEPMVFQTTSASSCVLTSRNPHRNHDRRCIVFPLKPARYNFILAALFLYLNYPVSGHIFQRLNNAGRPANFH